MKSMGSRARIRVLLSVLLPAEQFCKTSEAATRFEEIMFQQLLCCGAAVHSYAQTDAEERFELFAELLRSLEPWGTIGGNQVQSLEGFLVQIWGFGLDHLNSHDTQRPAVNLGAIFFLLDDLRRHPIGGTNHRGTLAFRFSELSAETEISWVVC